MGICIGSVSAVVPNDPLYYRVSGGSDLPVYGQSDLKHLDAESAWEVTGSTTAVLMLG